MKTFLEIVFPKPTQKQYQLLTSGYQARDTNEPSYKYQCGFNNVSYFTKKMPGFKVLNYNVNNHHLDFLYKGVTTIGVAAVDIRESIKQTGARRSSQYKAFLPIMIPALSHYNLPEHRKNMPGRDYARLMQILGTCGQIQDLMESITFTQIDYRDAKATFTLAGTEYKNYNIFALKNLAEQANK